MQSDVKVLRDPLSQFISKKHIFIRRDNVTVYNLSYFNLKCKHISVSNGIYENLNI